METFTGEHGHRVTIERLESVVPVDEYVKICVDIPKFLGYCKECPNYGNRWSCPPFEKDPMKIWSQYEVLRLIAYTLPSEPGQDVPTALDNLKTAKDRMMAELLEHPVRRSLHPSGGKAVPEAGTDAVLY